MSHNQAATIRHQTRGFAHRVSENKVATAEELRLLPLHAKAVAPMLIDKVLELMNDQASARTRQLLEHLKTKVPSELPLEARCRLRATVDHATQLVDAGIAKPIPTATAAGLNPMQMFCVVEQKTTTKADPTRQISIEHETTDASMARLRPIFWPQEFLHASAYNAELSLQTAALLRSAIAEHSTAAAFDLAAAYMQIEMPGVYMFQDQAGTFYELLRMPYGVDAAAEIMDLVTAALAGRNDVAKNPARDVFVITHIDNALAAGEPSAVEAWIRLIRRRASRCSAQFNEEPANSVASVVPFCGTVGDFRKKVVWLSAIFISKLRKSANNFTSGQQITMKQLHSLHARLVYAAAALGVCMAATLYAIFYIKIVKRLIAKRNAQQIHDNDVVNLPPAAARGLLYLINVLGANTPTSVLSAHPSWQGHDAVLYTDATPRGWGAVLLAPGRAPVTVGAAWPQPMGINDAESLAVIAAMDLLHGTMTAGPYPIRHIKILIDNTSAIAVCNATAKAANLQLIGLHLQRLAQARGLVFRVEYVRSLENLADAPSRFYDAATPIQRSTHPYHPRHVRSSTRSCIRH